MFGKIKRPGVGGNEVETTIGSEPEKEQKPHEPRVLRDTSTPLPDGNEIKFKATTTPDGKGFRINTGLKGFKKPEKE